MTDRNTPELVNWAQFFPSDDKKLGDFLTRSGRPVNCRLDFRLTSLEELKKAAVVVSELNQKLQKFAYETEGDPVLRVMLARGTFSRAQFDLRYVNPAHVIKIAKEKEAAKTAVKKALKTKKTKPAILLGDIVLEAEKLLDDVFLDSKKSGGGG